MRERYCFLILVAMTCGCAGQGLTGLNPTKKAGISYSLRTGYVAPKYDYLPTYDGTGQEVEPCVLYTPGGWNGYQYWMTAAPYPFELSNRENASIWASNDAPGPNQHWVVPHGVVKPVIPLPAPNYHNADQSLLLDTDGTMYLYYASTQTTASPSRRGKSPSRTALSPAISIDVVSSKDGWKTVSSPTTLISTTYAKSHPLVPMVLYDPGSAQYYMWYTDIGNTPHLFVRLSGPTALGPFGNPVTCSVQNIPSGRDIWEENIIHSPDGTALYALMTLASQVPQGSNTDLHFMSSTDGGLTWALDPSPIFQTGAAGAWAASETYRGSLQPTSNTLQGLDNHYDLWYSADDANQEWHVGYASSTISGS